MKTDKEHGIDCKCEECAKIRDYLYQRELFDDIINIIGCDEDLEKLRR